MRILLTIGLLVFWTSSILAGDKGGNVGRKRLRRQALARYFSADNPCAQAVTGKDMVDHIARSANFRALEKPGQVEGTRYLKLVILKMKDGSLHAAYGPLSLGIFFEPALDKLGEHYLNLAIVHHNSDALDHAEPVAVWVGEIETVNGSLTKASYRDLRQFPNDERVLRQFIQQENFPWAVASTFHPIRLRAQNFHLRSFMNLPGAREYTEYYEDVGNALGNVARAYELVQGCLDRGEIECARTHFRETARLARDGQESGSRNGLIVEFEQMAREDGLSYPGEKDQDKFKNLMEAAAVSASTATREDMAFFRKAISRLSAWANLSRPNTQVPHATLFPLIYIVTAHGRGEVDPFYDR